MEIQSHRLGTVEVSEEDVLTFPSGLVGMPHRRRFVLMEFGDGIPLGWLQDVEDGEFGLPVADPGIFRSDYQIETTRGEVDELEIRDVADAVILIVTTIASGGVLVTGNLRAPLVVNANNRRGRQVVLDRPDLDLRSLVDPVAFARARERAEDPESPDAALPPSREVAPSAS